MKLRGLELDVGRRGGNFVYQ